jgi:hypothetical protein
MIQILTFLLSAFLLIGLPIWQSLPTLRLVVPSILFLCGTMPELAFVIQFTLHIVLGKNASSMDVASKLQATEQSSTTKFGVYSVL